ncbi:hypothetical protein [Streptomyces sp. NPDC088794]|uniref:hypothetical protein n=1 Tax=Streptomyces sp. NPDC088794 TaxID=3365902 RepID=UPI00380A51CC
MLVELRLHMELFAGKGADGLVFSAEGAAGFDATVRKGRQEAAAVPDEDSVDPDDQRSGTDLARDE